METIYSNIVSIQVMGNQTNYLEIADYKVSILCPSYGSGHNISASGTVLYNGNPVPNVTVKIGFCSAYDPTNHSFSTWIEAETDGNGNFSSKTYLFTQTPPGGQNCIAAVVYYNNMYADKMMTVTIPSC